MKSIIFRFKRVLFILFYVKKTVKTRTKLPFLHFKKMEPALI